MITGVTSVAQELIAARDSLTEENWNKGSYFSVKNNTICMCAHGAIQAQSNSVVKTVLGAYIGPAGAATAWVAAAVAAAAATWADQTAVAAAEDAAARVAAEAEEASAEVAAASAAEEASDEAAAEAAWVAKEAAGAAAAARSAAATAEEASDEAAAAEAWPAPWENKPNWVTQERAVWPDYVAGLVGLTTRYNDNVSTSLTDVKNKLTQAAELAERLGL